MPRAFAIEIRVLALAALALLGLALASRLTFPWPLEWEEGGSLQHALRLLAGQPLYGPPTAEFIPYIYPPLGYVPMALGVALFGPTLFAARLPSVLFFLASGWGIARIAARAAGDATAGWLAAGLWAAAFGYCGAFMDLARIDACLIALLVAGAACLQARRVGWGLLCLGLACFAKQHGLLFLLAASGWLLYRDARAHALAVVTAWAAVVLGELALERYAGGDYARYVFAAPAGHRVVWSLLADFFGVDLLAYLPVVTVAAGAALAGRWRRLEACDALLAAGLLSGALGRIHFGGFDNVRLPATAMLLVVAAPQLVRWARRRERAVWVGVATAVQFALLFSPPGSLAPPPGSAAEFASFQTSLQRCAAGGRGVALDFGMPVGAPYVHTMALFDLRIDDERPHANPLADQARRALLADLARPNGPSAVAVRTSFEGLNRVLSEHFEPCERRPAPPLATGYAPPAQIVYRRRPPGSPPRDAPPAGTPAG